MRTLNSIGVMVATGAIAMGLTAGAAVAGVEPGFVSVTLPETVNVGDTTLAAGPYRVSEVPLAGAAESIFVFRDENGHAAAVVTANKTADPSDVNSWGGSRKTELVLTPSEDGSLHLNKMFIEGDHVGYNFPQ